MADTPNDISTAEDRQKKIAENTTFGKYTAKQLFNTVVQVVGIGGGFLLGKKLNNTKLANTINEKVASSLPKEAAELGKGAFIFATTTLGAIVSTMALAYEHWKNAESEKLAVAEINKDVAKMVDQRAKFADTLTRQEDMIKKLVAERSPQQTHTERAAAASATQQGPQVG